MLDLRNVRSPIVQGLKRHTVATAIIQSEGGGDKPAYPYIELKFTNPGTRIGRPAEFMQGGLLTQEQDHELTMSISCYAADKTTASNLAYSAVNYFDFLGVMDLQEQNIAVVETTTMQDRTTVLTTDYEHRIGFDVRLRVRTKAQMDAGTVNHVNINHNP